MIRNSCVQHEREAVAKAIGLRVDDLDPTLPVETVSTGLPSQSRPFVSLAVLRELRIDPARVATSISRTAAESFSTLSAVKPSIPGAFACAHAFLRGEDPATGSAAGCAAAWMVAHGVAQPEERVLIEQGIEMKRPSQNFRACVQKW